MSQKSSEGDMFSPRQSDVLGNEVSESSESDCSVDQSKISCEADIGDNTQCSDIVILEDLLTRMKEDSAVSKCVVKLFHKSFFSKTERPKNLFVLSIELIKTNKISSREFFRHVPRYIAVDTLATLMIQIVKTIHFNTSKLAGENSSHTKRSTKKIKRSLSDLGDIEALEAVVISQKPEMVSGLFDAVCILYYSCNLSKSEHKAQLEMVIGNLSKWMEDLILYYKDTPVWISVFYLASHIPSMHVPSLARICHKRLTSYSVNELNESQCTVLLHCLCNQYEGSILLSTLKSWISLEFDELNSSKSITKPPGSSFQALAPKRRKVLKTKPINSNASFALKMLIELLDTECSQKILVAQNSKELKSFLDLYDCVKLRVESLQVHDINEEESIFIINLLLTLVKIAVILQDKDNNENKMLEDIVIWIEDKLTKIVESLETSTTGVTSSIAQKFKYSSDFKKLIVDMSKELCEILIDVTKLGIFDPEKSDFLKFGFQLLNLDRGSASLLLISKLFHAHIWHGTLLYLSEKQETMLAIAPDCFFKINKICLVSSIPGDILREIKENLTESLDLLKKCYGSAYQFSCSMPLLTTTEPQPPVTLDNSMNEGPTASESLST